MNALLLIRPHLKTASALAVVSLGALALSTLRSPFPMSSRASALLLFGWLGVALGRLSFAAAPVADRQERDKASAKSDRIDAILRSIAKILQSHASASEDFSERLDGVNLRLAQQADAAPVRDIVLALIEDNRHMRDKLSDVREKLEESRMQVLQLRNNLERSEEEGLRDVGDADRQSALLRRNLRRRVRAGAKERAQSLPCARRPRPLQAGQRPLWTPCRRQILRLFAEILVQNVRGQDRVARFGGEEFALMLPGVSLEDAMQAVEGSARFSSSKQWMLGPTGERVGTITASFGVASLLT